MNTGSNQLRVPLVDLAAQQAAVRAELDAAAARVLSDAEFILGRDVDCFEKEFAQYSGCAHGVGVDSGTSALELALRAYGVGPGDEVIVPANTFIATALAVSATGAIPVLVDVDPLTYTIDVTSVEDAITARTRAIIPVHLYGQPADMDPLLEIARRRQLVVIEDACQAHGARYKGRRVGSLGSAAAFSFYPSKNLGACGDGGIVTTSDEDIAKSLRMLRNYGQEKKYHHVTRGYNRRLDNLQAALLRVKLRHLDVWNEARRDCAEWYRLLLSAAVVTPVVADYAEPVWHLYVVQVDDREEMQRYLDERGIGTGIHYPIPVHLQSAYRDLGYLRGDFPIAEQTAENILSLPMYPELQKTALTQVADAVAEFVATHRCAVPHRQVSVE
jgi:dTDP-4-amino-4,6-dideoxygalactose transaminase